MTCGQILYAVCVCGEGGYSYTPYLAIYASENFHDTSRIIAEEYESMKIGKAKIKSYPPFRYMPLLSEGI
ncbi:MAG: hypothetical protein KJ906_02415 [Nanoarchaeota archaeon]|nr:hypothetical protein [Nanoarchaeota archaeon]